MLKMDWSVDTHEGDFHVGGLLKTKSLGGYGTRAPVFLQQDISVNEIAEQLSSLPFDSGFESIGTGMIRIKNLDVKILV